MLSQHIILNKHTLQPPALLFIWESNPNVVPSFAIYNNNLSEEMHNTVVSISVSFKTNGIQSKKCMIIFQEFSVQCCSS